MSLWLYIATIYNAKFEKGKIKSTNTTGQDQIFKHYGNIYIYIYTLFEGVVKTLLDNIFNEPSLRQKFNLLSSSGQYNLYSSTAYMPNSTVSTILIRLQ